jgi:putative endonuclease
MPDKRTIGNDGERRALDFLRKRGFSILATNFRTRGGEIDIIVRKKNLIAFIEVKTRLSSRYGSPEEAIDRRKTRRMIKTAKYFLCKNGLYGKTEVRFDVLAVLRRDATFEIEHFTNAFREER